MSGTPSPDSMRCPSLLVGCVFHHVLVEEFGETQDGFPCTDGPVFLRDDKTEKVVVHRGAPCGRTASCNDRAHGRGPNGLVFGKPVFQTRFERMQLATRTLALDGCAGDLEASGEIVKRDRRSVSGELLEVKPRHKVVFAGLGHGHRQRQGEGMAKWRPTFRLAA